MIVTRFAPSPNGFLHLGHALSALTGFRAAHAAGGRFLLRIEDIDTGRARPEFEQAIHEDLAWLGLEWERPVRRQSEHFGDYEAALTRLDGMGLTYPCFCTRKDIEAEIARSPAAPHGPEGALYPGICRHRSGTDRAARIAAGEKFAVRLDVEKALALTGPLSWHDKLKGEIAADPASLGDVVLARKDIPTSYHLAVTVDDALQGVTLVTRGEDLFHATHIHRLLQALLDLPVPAYWHHGLIRDANGDRLAKSKGAPALRDLRTAGMSAEAVVRRVDGTA
ncbi:tRNA glutamyl-Q(34) synthetase GluQRS [Iodidimonas sp. SYSU 1G8]|uniref:tRNA glutamyl-Q(34) synthetase GluQRS n=1 Tax=Iodidimonas sp. SYSU 1G8 TaxID=3133967 RepID=UPI0031FE9705